MRARWSFADVAAHSDSAAYDESNARIDSHLRRFTDSAPLFAIPPGARVLDVDCRTANGTIFLSRRCPSAQFWCVAMARRFDRIAREKLRQRGLTADVQQLHDLSLPFDRGWFDVVLCYETLEHVPDPAAFLAEVARVLRPGGALVLTTPNRLREPVPYLSARLGLDHGESPPHASPGRAARACRSKRGVHRGGADLRARADRPAALLTLGRWLEARLPEGVMRRIALRRTLVGTRRPSA